MRTWWRDDAVCGRLDQRTAELVFFGPEGKSGAAARQYVDRARALCETCPVLFECLDDALRVPEYLDRYGVRAGLLPDERADLRPASPLTPQARAQAAMRWLGGNVDDDRRLRPSHNRERRSG